ncbi:MAG TPA: lasso peptide biosynthesis B2 protein [Mobilitalea sp.]|nr:lasso peptide biosynthesis B2 protein [Mobilitalea sp.]
MIRRLKKAYLLFACNDDRGICIKALFLSAFYRFCVLMIPMKKLQSSFGIMNEESEPEETMDTYRYAAKVANAVNRICNHTPWESKCLVKALSAQCLLKKNKIPSTLYLGVGTEGEHMIAHAWLRSGKFCVTGGNGEGYALVAKFRA